MKIAVSIKPEHTKNIENQIKNYEFRSYLMNDVDKLYVYESNTSCLKYIMDIDKIVKSPDKIEEEGLGNEDFNKGYKYKYAYHIKHLYKLDKPITLTELKSRYKFYAPQKYTFMDKYPELLDKLKKVDLKQIF